MTSNNEVSDLVLYALGLKSKSTLTEDMQSFMYAGEPLSTKAESWSYEELCGTLLPVYLPRRPVSSTTRRGGTYVDLSDDELGLKTLYDNGLEVRITGIIRQNKDATSGNDDRRDRLHPRPCGVRGRAGRPTRDLVQAAAGNDPEH